MKAGRLRHYATIQREVVPEANTRGQKKDSYWENVYENVPCEIITLMGRELEQAHEIVAQANTRVSLRYHPNMDEKCRFVWNGRVFNIQWINNVEQRNRELICYCIEPKGNNV